MNEQTADRIASIDAAFEHLWLHLAVGAAFSEVLLAGLVVGQPLAAGRAVEWGQLWATVPAVLGLAAAAAVVGLLRMPALRWLGRRAGQQRWPVAGLLLAAAVLFEAPLLPLLALGEGGRLLGRVCLVVSAPFLLGYVAATYRLRRRLTAPASRPPGAA